LSGKYVDLDDQSDAEAIGVIEAACGLRDVLALFSAHGSASYGHAEKPRKAGAFEALDTSLVRS
jgi:hypothetical protein